MADFNININEVQSNIVGQIVAVGDLVYLGPNGKYYKTNATTTLTSSTELKLCLTAGAANTDVDMLVYGYYTFTNGLVLLPGTKYYVSSDLGEITTQIYSSTFNYVNRYVGTAVSATKILFNPDQTYIHEGGKKINEIPLNFAHKHLESDITDLDKYTKAQVDALITGSNPDTFEQGRYEGTLFTNHDLEEVLLPELNDASLGGIHAFRYVGYGFNKILAASRNTSGPTKFIMFNNPDDLTDYTTIDYVDATHFGVEQMVLYTVNNRIYATLSDPSYTLTNIKVVEWNLSTNTITEVINYDTTRLTAYPVMQILGNALYVAEGYYAGKISKFDLTTKGYLLTIDPLTTLSAPHSLQTDGVSLFGTTLWDGGSGCYAFRIKNDIVEETFSYDFEAILSAGFTDDFVIIGDYIYAGTENRTENGIYKINKNALSDFVKLDVIKDTVNANIYAIEVVNDNIIYVGESTIGSFNVNTRESVLFENPFTYSPNEIVIYQDRMFFAGFDTYPVTGTAYVGRKASPLKAIRGSVLATDGSVTITNEYDTGFTTFRDFIGLRDDNKLQGVLGTVIEDDLYVGSAEGLFITHTQDNIFDENDGGMLMSPGKVELRGQLAVIDSLKASTTRQVYVNSEGALFGIEGVAPDWTISDTDIGVYAFTAGWVNIPTLAVAAQATVDPNTLVNFVANIYIDNPGLKGGFVDVGYSLNGAVPVLFKTIRVEAGFSNIVPIAFSLVSHPGFAVTDIFSVSIGGLNADPAGAGSFTPSADGTLTFPHELTVSVPGVGSGGGDVYLAGDNVMTGANTFNQPIVGTDATLSTHLVTKSQLDGHGFTGTLANNQVAIGTAVAGVLDGSAGLTYDNGNLLNLNGYFKINYTGADDQLTRPFEVDTSGSLQDNQPAFLLKLRATGQRKGFQIVNGADAAAWASFGWQTNGVDTPGVAFGNGTVRDVGLYRDGTQSLSVLGDSFKTQRFFASNGASISRDEVVNDAILELKTSTGVNVFTFSNTNNNTTPVSRLSYGGGYFSLFNGVTIRREAIAGTSEAFKLQDNALTSYFKVLNDGTTTILGNFSAPSGTFTGTVSGADAIDADEFITKNQFDNNAKATPIPINQIVYGTGTDITSSAALTFDGSVVSTTGASGMKAVGSTIGDHARFAAFGTSAAYPRAGFLVGNDQASTNWGFNISPDTTTRTDGYLGLTNTSNDQDALNHRVLMMVYDQYGMFTTGRGGATQIGGDLVFQTHNYVREVNPPLTIKGNNGNVLIKTDTDSGAALNVGGTIQSTAGFIYNDGSVQSAVQTITVAGTVYDAKTTYSTPVFDWSMGIDNSDSDIFKISNHTNLQTNTAIEISTGLNTTFFGDITANQATFKGETTGGINLRNDLDTDGVRISTDDRGRLFLTPGAGATNYVDIIQQHANHAFLVHNGVNWGGFGLSAGGNTRLTTNSAVNDIQFYGNNWTTELLTLQGDGTSAAFSGTASGLNPVGAQDFVTLDYFDNNSSSGNLLNIFINTAVNYSTASLPNDTDKTIVYATGATVLTLDATGLTIGHRIQLLNNTGSNVTISSPNAIVGVVPALPNGYFAYATLIAANTWAVAVSQAGGAGGGGGDVYLANTQTFTGVNTFSAATTFSNTVTVSNSQLSMSADQIMQFGGKAGLRWLSAAGTLSFAERFSSGMIPMNLSTVGLRIGQSSTFADEKLQVDGNIKLTPSSGTLINGTKFIVESDTGYTSVKTEVSLSGIGLEMNLVSPVVGWARTIGGLNIDGVRKFSFGAYGSAATPQYLYLGNTYNDAALKVTDTGEVGVGFTSTTEPAAGAIKLQVVGKGSFTDQVTIPVTPIADTDAASKKYVDNQATKIDSWGGAWDKTNLQSSAQPVDLLEYDAGYFEASTASNTSEWVKINMQFGAVSGEDGQVELMCKFDEDDITLKTIDIIGPGRPDITKIRIVKDTAIVANRRFHVLVTFDGLASGNFYMSLGSRIGKVNVVTKSVYALQAFAGTPSATLAEIDNPANSYYYPAVGYLGSGGGGGVFSGTVTTNQIGYGTALDTFGGSNNLTWDGSTLLAQNAGNISALTIKGTVASGYALQRFETPGNEGEVYMLSYGPTHGALPNEFHFKNINPVGKIAFSVGGSTATDVPVSFTSTALVVQKSLKHSNDADTINGTVEGHKENLSVGVGTSVISSTSDATKAIFYDYVIENGVNIRAGRVMACHDGTNVEYTESSTSDLGDTTDVNLSVAKNGALIELRATTTTAGWIIRAKTTRL